jgi:hypothetical protein
MMDKRTKEYRATHPREAVLTSHETEITPLTQLKAQSIPCYYARFHQPVPPGYDKEPVSEFKVKSGNKYGVEAMLYHPTAGLIFDAVNKKGEQEEDIVPAANVIYVRV